MCVCKSFTTFCAVISWSCCFFYWHVIWEPQLSAELLNFTPIRLFLLFQTVSLKIEGSIYEFWEQWNCGLLIKFRLWRGLHFWVSCVFSFFNNVDVWNTHTGFLHETRAVASFSHWESLHSLEEVMKKSWRNLNSKQSLFLHYYLPRLLLLLFFISNVCMRVCVYYISDASWAEGRCARWLEPHRSAECWRLCPLIGQQGFVVWFCVLWFQGPKEPCSANQWRRRMSELSRSKSCGESFHGTQQALGLMQYMNRCTLSSRQSSQILQQCSEIKCSQKTRSIPHIGTPHRWYKLINGKAFEWMWIWLTKLRYTSTALLWQERKDYTALMPFLTL